MSLHRVVYLLAAGSLIALILLCLLWELYIAPLRVGGSLLALKALPLLLPLTGVLTQRVYSYQWAILLILFYFSEGVMRLFDQTLASQICAAFEMVFALIFFLCSIIFIRHFPKKYA